MGPGKVLQLEILAAGEPGGCAGESIDEEIAPSDVESDDEPEVAEAAELGWGTPTVASGASPRRCRWN